MFVDCLGDFEWLGRFGGSGEGSYEYVCAPQKSGSQLKLRIELHNHKVGALFNCYLVRDSIIRSSINGIGCFVDWMFSECVGSLVLL